MIFFSKPQCPIPSGVYHMYGYKNNIKDLPSVLESGEYMVKAYASRNGQLLNGSKTYVTVVNKMSLGSFGK